MGRGTGNCVKTRLGGKEILLRPHAPLGAIRTNDDDDDSKLNPSANEKTN